jgi:hypothetical protein
LGFEPEETPQKPWAIVELEGSASQSAEVFSGIPNLNAEHRLWILASVFKDVLPDLICANSFLAELIHALRLCPTYAILCGEIPITRSLTVMGSSKSSVAISLMSVLEHFAAENPTAGVDRLIREQRCDWGEFGIVMCHRYPRVHFDGHHVYVWGFVRKEHHLPGSPP